MLRNTLSEITALLSTYPAPSSWVEACPAPPSCRCWPPGGDQLCRGDQAPPRQTGTGGCSISSAAWEHSADASCPSYPLSSECLCPSSKSLCTWWRHGSALHTSIKHQYSGYSKLCRTKRLRSSFKEDAYHSRCILLRPTYILISFFGRRVFSTSAFIRRSKKGRRTYRNIKIEDQKSDNPYESDAA